MMKKFTVQGICLSCDNCFEIEYDAESKEEVDIYSGGNKLLSCGCSDQDWSDYYITG